MRNILSTIIALIVVMTLSAQSDYDQSIHKYQDSLSETYENPEKSILSKKQLSTFDGLKFYTVDSTFRVSGTLKRTPESVPFNMQLSSGLTREYVMYGTVSFEVAEKTFTLPVYQNTYYRDHPEEKYGNSLFLPFTDFTSGDGSYGGGRYLDLVQEDIVGRSVVIDFNKSYNPYCAYTTGYSCPIPPEANDLRIKIEAGVKEFDGDY